MTVHAVVSAATDYSEQASVTNWPGRIGLVIVMVALVALALWGMRRGWLNRASRQSGLAAPPQAPESLEGLGGEVEGLFLGTSVNGDWMNRIVVFDLGVRSRVTVLWGPGGVWFRRIGARDLFVPASAIVDVRTDRGVAGTVRAKDSVIVVSWRLGDVTVDTGFRADETSGHRLVLDGLVSSFAPATGRETTSNTTGEA